MRSHLAWHDRLLATTPSPSSRSAMKIRGRVQAVSFVSIARLEDLAIQPGAGITKPTRLAWILAKVLMQHLHAAGLQVHVLEQLVQTTTIRDPARFENR
jgi:hypothetical protein